MTHMTHGKNSTYQQGCRCRECRTAHKVATSKWRGKYTPAVDAKPVLSAIDYTCKTGIEWMTIAPSKRSVSNLRRHPKMTPATRDRILKAIRVALEEQQERLADALSALEVAEGASRARRWPTEPLRAVVPSRKALGSSLCRAMYRPTIPEPAVIEVCRRVGVQPEDVYPDWAGAEAEDE